jgi:type I restriction enzyme R subunit
LKDETDKAIALFGNKDAGGIVLLKTFDEYYNGYEDDKGHKPGYEELINELAEQFPLGQPIVGEESQKEFIRLYGAILRLSISLIFDDFDAKKYFRKGLQDLSTCT